MNGHQPCPGDVGLSGVKAQGLVSLAIRLGSVLRHEKVAGIISAGLFLALPLGFAIGGAVGAADSNGFVNAHGNGWIIAGTALLCLLLGLVVAVACIVVVAAVWGFASRNKDWFSHSFIIHHVDSDGTVWITESVGTGARTVRMHYHPGDYVWLKTSVLLTGDDETEMREFLDAVTAARWKYDYATFAGLAIFCITGAMLPPAGVGTAICSGLTSEALTRGRAIWPLPSYRMMPQDQWWHAAREGIEVTRTDQ